MCGIFLVANWSRSQVSVEVELRASVKGRLRSNANDTHARVLGYASPNQEVCNTSVVQGTLSHQQSVKVRLVEVRRLWLQNHIASGNVVFLDELREAELGTCAHPQLENGERSPAQCHDGPFGQQAHGPVLLKELRMSSTKCTN